MIQLLCKILLITFLAASCKEGSNYMYFDNPEAPRFSKKNYAIKNIFNNAQVDILWIIDNSGSMGTIQSNVVKNSQIFMNNFIKGNTLDWKIGLMSTDRGDTPYVGFSTRPLNPTTIDPVTTFQDAVRRLGTGGNHLEYVFRNVDRGIVDYSFLRPNSHLAIIMVTDEKEQSYDKFGSKYEWLSFLERTKAFVGAEHNLRFYGALSFRDLAECSSSGAPYAGSPFESVINTTKGYVVSACAPDFGTQLAGIGKDILTLVESPKIMLSERPFIETLKVIYNGKELEGGLNQDGFWYYDRYFNSINFYNLDFSPDFDNDDIVITFQIDDGIDRDVE